MTFVPINMSKDETRRTISPKHLPPLAINGVREITDVESDDRGVDVRGGSGDEGARLCVTVNKPERKGE